jgi:hypothetical protein
MNARRLVLAVFCSLVGVFALAGVSAFAEPPVLTAQFGAADALLKPASVAVDQAGGDVYVIDTEGEGEALDRFDAQGNPVAFTAKGSYVSENRLTGTPGGVFRFAGPTEDQVAVDNSAGEFSGDVYVTDPNHGRIDLFSSSGAYLGALTGSGTPQSSFGYPCGVAVDASGRVYVGDYGGFIERYTPVAAGMPVSDADYTVSELSGVSEPCAVAVDSAGDVFASRPRSEPPWAPLSEFAAAQFPALGSAEGKPRMIAEHSATAAVDPTSGHVYVDEGSQIAVYNASGAVPELLETFGAGALSGRSYGLAVYDAGPTPTVYASDWGPQDEASAPTVDLFTGPSPARPVIVSESVTNVTAESAEIQGQVNPEFADTKYHFEYGLTASYGTSVPLAERDIGASGGPLGVQSATPVHLSGLAPGSAYHCRIVATNSKGTVDGADATFTTRPAAGPSGLLDGRAYEMVSPPDKEGALILGLYGLPGTTGGGIIQAETEGNSITYVSNDAFDKPVSGLLDSQYVATRDAASWSNTNVMPPAPVNREGAIGNGGLYRAFSSDLSTGLLLSHGREGFSPWDPEGLVGYEDYMVHNGLKGAGPGSFQALLHQPIAESASAFTVEFQGANPELTHIVLATPAALTPEAIDNGERNVYEWTPSQPAGSQLQLINILPKQTQGTPGATLGAFAVGSPEVEHAISADGSRVYFTDGQEQDLYLRQIGKPTVQVDAASGSPEGGGGVFQIASGDGARVFFTDRRRLTKDSTVNTFGTSDLYEYNAEDGLLRDLTVRDPAGADVQGVLGASEDGSYVYFVAKGVLAPGASRGACGAGGSVNRPEWRRCNLYVWHEGKTTLVARLSEADNSNGGKGQLANQFTAQDWGLFRERTARVSSDGRHVVFMSSSDLVGYDNRNAETGRREQEVYVYEAPSEGAPAGVLRCISCDPTGARPAGPSSIPGGTLYYVVGAIYQSRVISTDQNGHVRVFFDSANPLVPQDTNGQQDVYEWEEAGRGGCVKPGGCLGLVSSGTSGAESLFLDASANGDDVFFLTQARLAGADTDNLPDIYDARAPHVPGETVGSQAAVPVPPPCGNGDACRPPASAQPGIYGAPASATFSGVAGPVAQKSSPPGKRTTKKRHSRHGRRGRHRAHARGRRAKRAGHSRAGR